MLGILWGGCSSEEPKPVSPNQFPLPQRAEASVKEQIDWSPPPKRETKEEKARKQIAEHEARLEAEPDGKDTPAFLLATGNLYRQKLRDYEKATEYYLILIKRYPDSPQFSMAYQQLATCYEQLEDGENVRWAYKEMMRAFPDTSQEHLFAKQKLGLR